MAVQKDVRPGRLALLVFAVVVAMTFFAGTATASAQTSDTDPELQRLWDYLLKTPVSQQNCTFCHKSIADTKNYAGEIIFTHGYHLRMECTSCHSKFPHGQQGQSITQLPTMKMCWNCHGLRHGPMGELATGKCEKCHKTRKASLRPAFHTWDWAAKPHVKPGEDELQTKCMMCHDAAWCDDCHVKEFVDWKPKLPYIYDPGDGCQSCHGEENLLKLSGGIPKSYQVTNVMDSAHAKVTCIQCHTDFRYKEAVDRSKLWQVNAGLACGDCHDHDKARADYLESVHGKKVAQGNLDSATCGSCHGGHEIQRLDSIAASEALHAAAYRVCARCHKEQYESYNDYYHGAAYKRGATDAPACWECHGSHKILPSSDPKSLVAPDKVAETCSGTAARGACHRGSDASFANKAGSLIHQKVEARASNPLAQFIARVKSWLS